MNNCYKIHKDLTGDTFHNRVAINFNKNTLVKSDHIRYIVKKIQETISFWRSKKDELLDGILIQFDFNNIISKSKRISNLFSIKKSTIEMVGSHFRKEEQNNRILLKHSMVYHFHCISNLEDMCNNLTSLADFVDGYLGGFVNKEKSEKLEGMKLPVWDAKKIIKILLEISRIENVSEPRPENQILEDSFVRFYINPSKIFNLLNIDYLESSIIDKTVVLKKDAIEKILNKYPYFVASTSNKIYTSPETSFTPLDVEPPFIPKASAEPIVGVLDTAFDTRCYLYEKEWVEYHDLRNAITKDESIECKSHGTGVTSLIVHGDEINEHKGLDDGCGYFRVRHFAIGNTKYNSTLEIMNNIETAVRKNPDIKVWNLSLGTDAQINRCFISPVASLLDKLQSELDIIFVVAATNNPNILKNDPNNYRIGSPADSINSLVVSSNRFTDQKPASYSRNGPVLDFFIKPDVSYYGGDEDQKLRYFNGVQIVEGCGTSFSAPLVTRKVAYLVYKVGLSREVAKALIIDSASENENKEKRRNGRGIVPVHIRNILESEDDEIRFVFTGVVKNYKSTDFSLPIPINPQTKKNTFVGRATMCYMSSCSVNNGVDYTDIEVDLKFGPTDGRTVNSIKPDYQYVEGYYTNEKEAREIFSKWDNVKRIKEPPKPKYLERINNGSDKWGFKLITTYRNDSIQSSEKYGFKFGIVVTLKHVKGLNRNLDFYRLVQGSTWTIEPINIEIINKFNVSINEDVEFE